MVVLVAGSSCSRVSGFWEAPAVPTSCCSVDCSRRTGEAGCGTSHGSQSVWMELAGELEAESKKKIRL